VTAAADWTAWTCLVRVVVTGPAALDDARAVVQEHLDAVDHAASCFRGDSEIAALTAARDTDGDVDPTVGGSMLGLGYDRSLADGPLWPTPAPGWRSVDRDRDRDRDRRRVRVAPGVHLDLGATAKAWTADRAAAVSARRVVPAVERAPAAVTAATTSLRTGTPVAVSRNG
jgi:FAD:protein FMN transferase